MAFEQVLKMRTGIVGKSAREWDSYGNSGAERRAADLLKYAAETIDDLNSFLDDGFQIDNINEWQDKKHVGYNNTIRGDSSIAYIECYVLSKLDPWGTKYKIYGMDSVDGTGSWLQIVCFGPDKLEGVPGYKNRVDVAEQDIPTTVEVLMKTLPKTEHQTGIKFKYNEYVTKLLVESIVEATSEFKRVYGLGAMYPDIAFSVLTAAFSNALYNNKPYVEMIDVYNAIKNSKRIYPDSRIKDLTAFREKFAQLQQEENVILPVVTIDEIKEPDEF